MNKYKRMILESYLYHNIKNGIINESAIFEVDKDDEDDEYIEMDDDDFEDDEDFDDDDDFEDDEDFGDDEDSDEGDEDSHKKNSKNKSNKVTKARRSEVLSWLMQKSKDGRESYKINHADIVRRLYNPQNQDEEDSYRSLFSRKLHQKSNGEGGVYRFTDEELNQIWSIKNNFF